MIHLHSIPVGNKEPVHLARESCWCYPVQDTEEPSLLIHNAKDCRERFERQGADTGEQSLWVLVKG
jgi:hypothetical protein